MKSQEDFVMTRPVELKEGDKVKVVRMITSKEDKSFENSWVSDMTDNIGKIGVVTGLNKGYGYHVSIKDGGNYGYSRKSLRKVG
jgi:hypothetical protein